MADNQPQLAAFSNELSQATEKIGLSLVRVDDGSRLSATGIVWNDNTVLTTSHGVEQDEDLAIETGDGRRLEATLAGRDYDTDLAVLTLANGADLPVAEWVSGENEIRVGQIALAVARPGGPDLVATLGIVSALRPSQTGGQPEYLALTDAPLLPGFSGGALIDTQGRVLGLLNRMFGRGLGVALGVPLIARVATALLEHGRVRRGYLGIRTQLVALPETLRQTLNLLQERGLLLIAAEPNSPAEAANLLLGDTLLMIGGDPIEDVDSLRAHLAVAGEPIQLTILRGGQLLEVSATPAAITEE